MWSNAKKVIKKIPLANWGAKKILNSRLFLICKNKTFPGSKKYWEQRYVMGGNSGAGSYGKLAKFKAEIVNLFVENNGIKSVIDFGCGDGNQLSLFSFPNHISYIGLDVSKTVLKLCIDRFKDDVTKNFFLYDPECFEDNSGIFRADLVLSLDVIYHLIEDNIFELYMKHLFSSSDKFVIIYSDDANANQRYHEKHRQFSRWVETKLPEWELIDKIKNKIPNKSCADFFIYKKKIRPL